jgi:glycine zipper 2TM protein
MFRAWRSAAHSSVASPLVVLTLFVGMAACSNHRSNDASADSVLSHDLALANQATTPPPTFEDTALSSTAKAQAPKPEPKVTIPTSTRSAARRERTKSPSEAPSDVTPHPVPAAPMPTPAAAPAAVPSKEIGAGTGFSVTSGGKVCTSTNRPGDKIVATIDSPISGSNGALIPAGSKAVLEVASISPGDSPDNAQIAFRVRSIYVNDVSYNVDGSVTSSTPLERAEVPNSDPNADKKKVIGGAIAGAILGQIMGHSTKSTVIGAAAGAGAGAVAAHATKKYEACLPAGASLHVRLAQAVTM